MLLRSGSGARQHAAADAAAPVGVSLGPCCTAMISSGRAIWSFGLARKISVRSPQDEHHSGSHPT